MRHTILIAAAHIVAVTFTAPAADKTVEGAAKVPPPPKILRGLEGLRVPPKPPPREAPKLSPVLAGDDGRAVATPEAWRGRREEIRKRWTEFLGDLPKERGPLEAEIIEKEELPGFVRERVKYRIEDGVSTDGYLLLPRAAPTARLPAVVVFHQTTEAQAKQVAGVDASKPELMMGPQLVERGYVVLCPRCYIFEEGAGYAEHVKRMKEKHPGWKGMTRMLLDSFRAADYLESLPRVDRERIGCAGHSLGAKEALYAAAFDERYKAAVFSEGGIGLAFSNWEAPWYLGEEIRKPGFPLEHHQLMALIAPRGFLLLAGDSADDARSWAFVEAALPVYRLLGSEERVGWLRHGLGHRYPVEDRRVAEAFLDACLK